MFGDSGTFYDLLGLTPDATPQEIRDAYVKTKTTYSGDNLVLYTLVAPQEREDALKQVEDAYLVLSDPDKRREYDRNHGLYKILENPFASGDLQPREPFDFHAEGADLDNPDGLLIAPSTDSGGSPVVGETSFFLEKSEVSEARALPESTAPIKQFIVPRMSQGSEGDFKRVRNGVPIPDLTAFEALHPELVLRIQKEQEWPGSMLREVREAQKMTIEEIAQTTRISKNYLKAIESEEFDKLPATVYIRGFVLQIARILRLPAERACTSYVERVKKAREDQPA